MKNRREDNRPPFFCYLCEPKQMREMKKILFVVMLALLSVMSSCRDSDAIVGTWRVANVNIDFDEYKYTPDMVRQIGLEEKANTIILKADSTMLYVSGNDTLSGRFSLRNQDLYFNNEHFAVLRNDTLTETKRTVLGDVVIKYTKN